MARRTRLNPTSTAKDVVAQDTLTKSDIRSVFCIGDSLTEGNQDFTGYTVPGFLATALGAGVSVTNAGKSGWSSSELAVRSGGVVLTLGSFTLPTSGAVAVTVTAPSGLYWNAASVPYSGVLDVGGTLYPGTLTHTLSGNTFSFTRTTAGSSTAIAAGALFYSTEQVGQRGSLTVIEAGRNNVSDTNMVTSVTTDVAAIVANQSPSLKRTLVLSVHNSSNGSENSGSATYLKIKATNDALAATYGARFVDTRKYLIQNGLALNGITPTGGDTTAIANDCIPPSLLTADNIHPNQYGYKAMAMAIIAALTSLGWAADKLTTLPILTLTLPTPTVTFDASTLTLSAAVASWTPSQGTGTLNQGVGGAQPAVNAADSGGKRWVVFDGTNDELALSVPLLSQPKTIVMRVKARNLAAKRGLFWPSGTGVLATINTDGSVTVNATTAMSTPAGQVTANTDVTIGIVVSNADSLIQVGANTAVTGNPGANSQSSGYTRIGYAFSGSDVYAAMDVNKIVIYPTALNAIQLAQAVATA